MPIFMLFSPIITPRYLVENGTSKEAAIVQTFTKEDTVLLLGQGAAWLWAYQEVKMASSQNFFLTLTTSIFPIALL